MLDRLLLFIQKVKLFLHKKSHSICMQSFLYAYKMAIIYADRDRQLSISSSKTSSSQYPLRWLTLFSQNIPENNQSIFTIKPIISDWTKQSQHGNAISVDFINLNSCLRVTFLARIVPAINQIIPITCQDPFVRLLHSSN